MSHFQILNQSSSPKAFIGSTLGPTFPSHQDQEWGGGVLTGSEDASLSLLCQTRRIPESTHVMRVLQAKGGQLKEQG